MWYEPGEGGAYSAEDPARDQYGDAESAGSLVPFDAGFYRDDFDVDVPCVSD